MNNESLWTIIGVAVFLTVFGGYLNHLIYCFSHDMWGFLIAGAIFFPVGIFHGVYLFFV